ncbi:uncharacterized protein O3C94_021659 [Discoglossus pictus]
MDNIDQNTQDETITKLESVSKKPSDFHENGKKKKSIGEAKWKHRMQNNQDHGDPPRFSIQTYCILMKGQEEEIENRLDHWKRRLSGSLRPHEKRYSRPARPCRTQSLSPSNTTSEFQDWIRTERIRPTSALERAPKVKSKGPAGWFWKKRPDRQEEPNFSFKPMINKTIPDFKKLQKRFQKNLDKRKEGKMTVCKPFRLHTTNTDRHRMCDTQWEVENKLEQETIQEKKKFPKDVHPSPPTKTSQKRQEAIRMAAIQQEKTLQEEKKLQIQKRIKQRKIKCEVQQRLTSLSKEPDLQSSVSKKLKEFRERDMERAAEYRAELRDIEERVMKRPFLFERPIKNTAANCEPSKSPGEHGQRSNSGDDAQEKGLSRRSTPCQVRWAWTDTSESCSPNPDRLLLGRRYL